MDDLIRYKETSRIFVEDRTRSGSVNCRKIRRAVLGMLEILGLEKKCLSIAVLNDRQIHRMNRDYLNHDEPTDVIAFSHTEGTGPSAEVDGCVLLGDIAVSVQTARREARERGHCAEYEIFFYVCHGLLHLLGHDDDTPEKRRAMHLQQNRILGQLGIYP